MATQQAETYRLALEPEEVGGELLDILSRGLYSDARDAIREYAQNGVDAGASTIRVTVNGPRVVIRDDGAGMDKETLQKSRRFGISEKNAADYVGFRGIGVYSAFGMCESLNITTRQVGMETQESIRFNFGDMRRILERDRTSGQRAAIALTELLFEHIQFSSEVYTGDRDRDNERGHFTVVTLEGVLPEYRAQLSDFFSLASYLLNTLPVAFPEEAYGPTVNKLLRKHVGLNPVKVFLRIGNEPEEEVRPAIVNEVEQDAHCEWVTNSKDEHTAFIWYVLSDSGSRITLPTGLDEGSGPSGFLLKLKGFTLGNRLLLRPHWPPQGGRTLYHHYSGEVHLVEKANVYPNAARNDLESGPEKQAFETSIFTCFDGLNRKADLHRVINGTRSRIRGISETAENLKNRSLHDDTDMFELYRQAQNLTEELDKAERELFRPTRGRKAIRPNSRECEALDTLRSQIRQARQLVSPAARSPERRTARTAPSLNVPPQAAILEQAIAALESMISNNADPFLRESLDNLRSAGTTHAIGRAVVVLDELRVRRVELSDIAEASRKELRTLLGWAPTGPVSLLEALAEVGFSPSTAREEALLEALDRGILEGIGGRGQRYESILRSAAESVIAATQLQ